MLSTRKKGFVLLAAGAVLIVCDTLLGQQIFLAGTALRICVVGALAMALAIGMIVTRP
jgi:hypothetical protein